MKLIGAFNSGLVSTHIKRGSQLSPFAKNWLVLGRVLRCLNIMKYRNKRYDEYRDKMVSSDKKSYLRTFREASVELRPKWTRSSRELGSSVEGQTIRAGGEVGMLQRQKNGRCGRS